MSTNILRNNHKIKQNRLYEVIKDVKTKAVWVFNHNSIYNRTTKAHLIYTKDDFKNCNIFRLFA